MTTCREAFGPIVEQAVRKAVYAKENGIDTYLEPMLRATIRRALAEYAPASRPVPAAGCLRPLRLACAGALHQPHL